jgi:site-specific recombinase
MVAWRAMVRLQWLGLLGNVLVVAPLAYALALGYHAVFGHHLLSDEKAMHVLEAQSIVGPSVLFAALTGLFLWTSSMMGAVVDNWAKVTHLSDRLATSVRALRKRGPSRARERAERLTAKVGGLAANLTLGFLLGGVPAMCAILQLPVEIRHVTVSVGSVAMAYVAGAPDTRVWALACSGVLLIGLTNVMVSFSLALWFALTSARGAEGGRYAAALMVLGIRRWLRRRKPPTERPRSTPETPEHAELVRT